MSTLPCLSILQPWAWLIVNGHKDIENRTWATKFRGRILIHASKAYARKTHDQFAEELLEEFDIKLPAFNEIQTGGIVGLATIADCVRDHASPWKMNDCWGFVLKDQRVRPFVPLRGQLGIYRVPECAIPPSIEEQQQ
jgi:ASCH domain